MKILTEEQRRKKQLSDRARYERKKKDPEWKQKERARWLKYANKNREQINARKRQNYQTNPKNRALQLANAAKQNQTQTAKTWRKKYKQLPHVKLKQNLARRILHWLKKCKAKKTLHTLDLVGCSAQEFKTHIERQFAPWMTWDNHGTKTWHIDHIIPCANFDLTKEDEQKKCFHYTNLRPMAAKENISKGTKTNIDVSI